MISIIAPVFNAHDYLKETIRSVQSQFETHWQLILIDDCSTDNSRKIIKDIASTDNRIILLSTEKNSGPARARNIGIQYALEHQSDYLVFLESADAFD